MANCVKCGNVVDPGNKFCAHCGAPVQMGNAYSRKSDEIDFKIVGDDMQAVIITLDPGEGVRSEAGAMLYMQDGIEMSTGVQGGMWRGLKRMFTGESFFQTTFNNMGAARADVAFSAPYPGKIIPLDLSQSQYLCQKEAFLCAANGVDINVAFTKRLGAGFFGGEGFILQQLSGDGLAFIHAGGTIIPLDLQPDQSLRVDTGCLVAFQPTVSYEIKFIGGFKNVMFGGEGLFYAVLRGPGRVYLQTIPFNRLADRIVAASGLARSMQSGGGSTGATGSILGTITDMMNRD